MTWDQQQKDHLVLFMQAFRFFWSLCWQHQSVDRKVMLDLVVFPLNGTMSNWKLMDYLIQPGNSLWSQTGLWNQVLQMELFFRIRFLITGKFLTCLQLVLAGIGNSLLWMTYSKAWNPLMMAMTSSSSYTGMASHSPRCWPGQTRSRRDTISHWLFSTGHR